MANRQAWPHPPAGPTLTEAEIRDAGPQEIVDMLATAKRAADVAVKAERAGPGINGHNLDVQRATLEVAQQCARRALLVMDIVLEAATGRKE